MESPESSPEPAPSEPRRRTKKVSERLREEDAGIEARVGPLLLLLSLLFVGGSLLRFFPLPNWAVFALLVGTGAAAALSFLILGRVLVLSVRGRARPATPRLDELFLTMVAGGLVCAPILRELGPAPAGASTLELAYRWGIVPIVYLSLWALAAWGRQECRLWGREDRTWRFLCIVAGWLALVGLWGTCWLLGDLFSLPTGSPTQWSARFPQIGHNLGLASFLLPAALLVTIRRRRASARVQERLERAKRSDRRSA